MAILWRTDWRRARIEIASSLTRLLPKFRWEVLVEGSRVLYLEDVRKGQI